MKGRWQHSRSLRRLTEPILFRSLHIAEPSRRATTSGTTHDTFVSLLHEENLTECLISLADSEGGRPHSQPLDFDAILSGGIFQHKQTEVAK